jgi:hypothetical protein
VQLLSWTSNYQHIAELAVMQIFPNVLSGPCPHTTHLGPILIIPFHLHLGSLQRTHTWSFQTTVTKRFFIFFHVWVTTHLLILLITVTVQELNQIDFFSNVFNTQTFKYTPLRTFYTPSMCSFHGTRVQVMYSFYHPFTIVMKCELCSTNSQHQDHVLHFNT